MTANLATDYSQSNEQEMILAWADRRPNMGRFLDIGAADGVTASNTRALANRGWAGVCVEAAAWGLDALAELYTDRPDIALVQAALVPGEQRQPLTRFHYSHDLVSTTQDQNADTWRGVATFTPVTVAAVTVDELLDEFPGPYDMVSIDTEGTSLALWDEMRRPGRRDVFAVGALAVVEAENGTERWEIQQACHEGWARVGVTPNNVLLERL